jgi:hypothetical protein
MSASKQIAIKEVLNFEVLNYSTGASLFYADYASNTSIENSAERLDLRGGQGNYKLVSFDHTKNALMKNELPLVDLSFIELLTGKSMNVGSVNVHKREVLLASAGNTITLSATPVTGTLKVYLLEGNRDNGTEQTVGTPGSNQNEYSISGAIITLNSTTAPEDTKIVVSYDYATAATARRLTFTADKFPSYFRITADGLVTDEVTGESYVVKFDFKKVKPQNNFTLTMSSTDATKLDITWDLYAVDVTNDDGTTDKVYFTMTELA